MATNDEYVAWLSQYTQQIAQLDPIDKSIETRQDYHEAGQEYEDYLDYVDEWEWHVTEKSREAISRFLFLASKRHISIKCECHDIHILTNLAEPTLGDIIVDDLQKPMFQQCWYRTVANKAKKSLSSLTSKNIRLPDPIESLLSMIIKLKLANDGVTPILLPYDCFQSIWWTKVDRTSFAEALLKALTVDAKKHMQHLQVTMTPKVENPVVLLDFPDSDHGMHNLQDVLSEADFAEVMKFTNQRRTSIEPTARRITLQTISERRQKCNYCRKKRYPSGLSIFSIYYAPPGSGKTSAQNANLLVGFDTDWIGVGLNWLDYGLLLRKRIPIITNQPEAFIGSGVKILGIVKRTIRRGKDGKPLDSAKRLMSWAQAHDRNVFFYMVSDNEFLSDHALNLQIIAVVQQMIGNQVINLMPFYKNLQTAEWVKKFPVLMRKKEKENQGERQTLLE